MNWKSFPIKILAGAVCIINRIIYLNRLSIKLPSLSFSLFPFVFNNQGQIIVGRGSIIGKHSKLVALGTIRIGNKFTLNEYSRIVSHGNITIGHNVTIAQFVSILDHDHCYEMSNGQMNLNGYVIKPITIGSNVWIGDKVTICKGVSIGNNVIIGANSLVNKDIEGNCVAVGNPCRKVKSL
jgi:serine acetyltransferase